jgi:DNA-binding transcriptional LysR family regulator
MGSCHLEKDIVVMDRLESLRIFQRVAELSSFTLAAEGLGLSKGAVSSAVQTLEEEQGTRLLMRTTRRVQLTADGAAFYERSRDLLDDMEDLFTMFRQDGPAVRGRIRVDMSSGVARALVVPQLPRFLAAFPEVEVELGCTERRVDLVREGYDCVVRVGPLSDSGLVARRLGHFRLVNCASPAYLARHGLPCTLDDLARHKLIHFTPVLGGRRVGWEVVEQGQVRSIPMQGALAVNSAEAYQAACLAGLGLIQAPEPGVRHLLAQGQLVEVLPGHPAPPMAVSLLYPHRRHLARRVRLFMDWLAEQITPHATATPP